jgi:hypothetical protein
MDKTKAKGSKIKKHLSGPELSINQFDHYIKLIDSNLVRCEVLGVSRLNTEWGIYSAQMNRETKKYSGNLVATLFQYWSLSSQLLEAKYKNVGVSKARKVLQELKKEIPKYIIN